MIDLKGQTAIVTGGSRGIGRATCLLFAKAGAKVALSYRHDRSAAEEVVSEIHSMGGEAIRVEGDLSNRTVVEQLFEKTRNRFGRIDVVVGNAGIWKRGPIDEMSDTEWQETVDVNLNSIYLTCQMSAREMKPRRSGRIILVSSTAGQRGEAYYSHYAATKGAIIAMTKSLAAELGPFNIRVNAVAPGWVLTDMCTEVMSDADQRRAIEEGIPLGRIATAEDIAGPILFLASNLSDHIQGEIVNVNGGSVLCG